ncbi:hypothetical protein WMY93_016340 [Mugilogobius chulae]|uniref:C-type lectin domain-containing protein n=1 Tax=Mugilogobius chulae TaxID=88201 RepID=A0AAW0NX16_9GOBI
MHLSVIFLLCLPLARGWWVGLEKMTFEEARSACFSGDLATFSSNQELHQLLWNNYDLRTTVTKHSAALFWIGLEKPKDLCVVPTLDQRGFRFVDERTDSGLNVWKEEPKDTCTNVRCAALVLESGSWGLVSLSCRNKNHFICGPPEAESRPRPEPQPRPGTTPRPGPEPGLESGEWETSEVSELDRTTDPRLGSEETPSPNENPVQNSDQNSDKNLIQNPMRILPEFKSESTAAPGPSAGPEGPDPLRGASSPLGRRSCPYPEVHRSRFFTPDDSKPDFVSVHCWSGDVLLLQCVKGTWSWAGSGSYSDPEPSWNLAVNTSEEKLSNLTVPVTSTVPRVSGTLSVPVVSRIQSVPGVSGTQSAPVVTGTQSALGLQGLSQPLESQGLSQSLGAFDAQSVTVGSVTTDNTQALVHALSAVIAITLAVVAMIIVCCYIKRRRKESRKWTRI